MVLLAGSWFIGYAFSNKWLGNTTRILLSLVAGFAIYAQGISILKKRSKAGQTLILLGEAILILALFAGYQLYALFPASVAFALMVIVTGMTVLIALFCNLENLALGSIVATMIIPFFIYGDGSKSLFLISYILLIDIASLLMLMIRGWGKTFQVAWLGTLISSILLYFMSNNEIVYFFIAIFYLIFFLPAAYAACGKIDIKLPLNGILILISSTLALIIWIEGLLPFKWSVSYYSIFALLSIYFSYAMVKNWDDLHKNRTALKFVFGTIFSLNAMIFFSMATASITQNNDLSIQIISYFIQTLLAMGIASFVFSAPTATIGLFFYFLIPADLLLAKYPDILYTPFYTWDFAAICTATLFFPIAYWILHKTPIPPNLFDLHKLISAILGIFTGLFLMSLIWNICHNIIPNTNVARSIALMIYVIAGEALIYIGNVKQFKNLRYGGMLIIILVILRLFLDEIWMMPIIIRIITFIVTGFLLIGTAWFDKKSSTS